jgi:GNAT superfamily N-acetyltransferase
MITLHEEPLSMLAEHGCVPIRFAVTRVLEVGEVEGGFGGMTLTERAMDEPWIKDYDAIQGPERWTTRFNVSRWGLIAARDAGARIGGAVTAFGSDDVMMLEGRTDLAVLWDLRVAPEHRGRGVGSLLFRAAERWAVERGCRWLKVETQNINVDACRFYARRGCVLGGINRFAYPDLPDEVQLLWYRDLHAAR